MDNALEAWILDNRPYTHLCTRLKHFILYCRTLHPELSHAHVKRLVVESLERIMSGTAGRRWARDRCYERVIRLYGVNDQRTDAWHAKRGEMMTASEVYKLVGSAEAKKEIILRKLEPPPSQMPLVPIPFLRCFGELDLNLSPRSCTKSALTVKLLMCHVSSTLDMRF